MSIMEGQLTAASKIAQNLSPRHDSGVIVPCSSHRGRNKEKKKICSPSKLLALGKFFGLQFSAIIPKYQTDLS